MRLLSLLIESHPELTFHYSGDFDVQGLRIAAYFMERYPQYVQLWHFDAAAYLAALHEQGPPLLPADLSDLQRLPTTFSTLVETMLQYRQRAYQEAISALLLQDISTHL